MLANLLLLQAKEHGILDTLKAVIQTHEVTLATKEATGTLCGGAAEVEIF